MSYFNGKCWARLSCFCLARLPGGRLENFLSLTLKHGSFWELVCCMSAIGHGLGVSDFLLFPNCNGILFIKAFLLSPSTYVL